MKKILFILAVHLIAGSTPAFSQVIENALAFDGVDDYVVLDNVSSPLAACSDFTIEFWMKADSGNNTSTIRVNLFAINPAAPGQNKFAIIMGAEGDIQTGQLSIYEPQGSPSYLTSSTIVGDNICHHIAYVRTGILGEAFIDGESIGTLPVGDLLLATDRISLGQEWDILSPSDFYNGEIDELRIWQVARTQDEIRQNMHIKMSGNETGLIAYYDFDQGTPGGMNTGITSLDDKTPNNLDGTLQNFSLDGVLSNWIFSDCFAPINSIDYRSDKQVLVFPNPFNTSATITCDSYNGNSVIIIFNMLGESVSTITVDSGKKAFIQRDHLVAGIYFYTWLDSANIISSGKLIIVD